MDVKVDATMRWDGTVAVQRRRARRWVAVAAVVLPVMAVAVLSMWFVRAYVVPPTISIPVPMSLAAAPPEAPVQTQVTYSRGPMPDSAPEPALEAASEAVAASESVVMSPAQIPMVQSLLLAPPALTFSRPPDAAPDVVPQPMAEPQMEQVEAGVPIAGPIPLPPRRPRASVARASGPLPLPPVRPQQ